MKKSDKNSIDPKIGANLKKIMEWENLSGKALAETVGINPVTVSKYLTQKINMRETTARLICDNCSSENRHYRHEWLLGYDDFPTEEELALYNKKVMGEKSKLIFNSLESFQGFEAFHESLGFSVATESNGTKGDAWAVLKDKDGNIYTRSMESYMEIWKNVTKYTKFLFNELINDQK